MHRLVMASDIMSHIHYNVTPAYTLRKRCARYCLASFGMAFLLLGAIGVVVPGLPTVVFWILAAWCFGKSCPAIQRWIYRRRQIGPVIEQFVTQRTLCRSTKRRALTGMWLGMLLSAVIIVATGQPAWIIGLIIACGICVTAWIQRGVLTADLASYAS